MRVSWIFRPRGIAGQAGAFVMGFLLVTLTLVLRLYLDPSIASLIVVVFVPAILLTACVGGLWPGLFATLHSCIFCTYYLLPPLYSFKLESHLALLNVVSLAGTGLFIASICQFLRDTIQQRETANAELLQAKQSAELLAAIVQSSNDGIVGVSRGGIITSWNRAAERIFGYSAEEAVGVRALVFAARFIPPAEQAFERETLARLLEGHSVEPIETVRIRKDGQLVDVRVTISPVHDTKGEMTGISMSIHDTTEKKRVEEALRGSEQRLNLALDSAMMAAWEFDYVNNCTHWYPQLYKLVGLPQGAGIEPPSRLFDHVHPDDLSGLKAAMANIAGAEWFKEFRIVRPDGEVRWLISQGRLVRNAEGHPVTLIGICYDITERKQAEAEIRSSRAKLAAAMGSMSDAILISDIDGKFVHINDAFAVFNRFPDRDSCLIAQDHYPALFEINSPNGEPVAMEEWPAWRALRGEWGVGAEFMIRRKDTGEHWIASVNYSPIRDRDGVITGAVTASRDITKRKRAEENLRRSEEQYRALYENLRDGFAQMDMEGWIANANREFCRMLGYTPHELTDLNYAHIAPEQWHPLEGTILNEQILTRGYSDVYEMEYQRKDGTVFPVELRSVLLRDSDGDPESMWVVARDISERKAAEARLQRLRNDLIQVSRVNELGHVSSGIAHELNQPLAAMLNYANVAKRMLERGDHKSIEAAHTALSKATEQTMRAGEIVLRMRSLIEKQQGNRQVNDINAIINDAVALETAGGKLGGCAINLSLAEQLPPVVTDRAQIQHVLANLLRNAFDAMVASSVREVTVSSHVIDSSEVIVAVADTGPGISQEMADRLFMPFFTTKPGGMGIGLVISQSIIQAHGGQISVRPNLGGGTVFEFRLPAASSAAERHA